MRPSKPPGTFHERLKRGELVPLGTAVYGLCRDCGKVVQVNKWMFGSLHLCAPAEKS